MISYLFSSQELDYKDREVSGDVTKTHHVIVEFDQRYVHKVNELYFILSFSKLEKKIPLLKSRERFLYENSIGWISTALYVHKNADFIV